jgi:hypothetical protein
MSDDKNALNEEGNKMPGKANISSVKKKIFDILKISIISLILTIVVLACNYNGIGEGSFTYGKSLKDYIILIFNPFAVYPEKIYFNLPSCYRISPLVFLYYFFIISILKVLGRKLKTKFPIFTKVLYWTLIILLIIFFGMIGLGFLAGGLIGV